MTVAGVVPFGLGYCLIGRGFRFVVMKIKNRVVAHSVQGTFVFFLFAVFATALTFVLHVKASLNLNSGVDTPRNIIF